LLWSFDAVRRLRDAHAQQLHPALEPYIEPRVLWWAFDPGLARMRGSKNGLPPDVPAAKEPGLLRGKDHPSVVLIDEIDKADPDVPNDLLVSLGSQKFRVDEIGSEVSVQNRVLVFITSNNERSLPAAFLRRCVIHNLQQPDEDRLVKIAENHFVAEAKRNGALFRAVAKKVVSMREPSGDSGQPPPSTAEYLDAIRACLKFGVQPGDTDLWKAISSSVLVKKTQDVAAS
jgi:MoxR-like ATPase